MYPRCIHKKKSCEPKDLETSKPQKLPNMLTIVLTLNKKRSLARVLANVLWNQQKKSEIQNNILLQSCTQRPAFYST